MPRLGFVPGVAGNNTTADIYTTSDMVTYAGETASGNDSTDVNVTTKSPLCLLNDYCESIEDYTDRLENYIYPESGEWGLIAAYIVTFLVGLIGNSLVCFAVWRNKHMRTITNIFIVNLAAADLGVIIICLPSTLLVDVTQTWFMGIAFCKIHLFLMTVSVSVSVLTLTAISIERWYAICHPLRFHSTIQRARCIIIVIWSISASVAIPELVSSTVVPYKPYTTLLSTCYPALWDDNHIAAFQVCLMIGLYFIPLCLMGFAYRQIAVVLWTDNLQGTADRHSRQSMLTGEQLDSRKKAAKMLVVVVVVFGLCFLPVHVLNILRYTGCLEHLKYVNILALFAHWATFLNSCINPIIYNFMSDKFRKEFKIAVFMCFRCGRRAKPCRQDIYRMTYSSKFYSHYNNRSNYCNTDNSGVSNMKCQYNNSSTST